MECSEGGRPQHEPDTEEYNVWNQIWAPPAPWLPSFLATTSTVGEESSQDGITLLTELLLAVHICACAAQHPSRSKFRVEKCRAGRRYTHMQANTHHLSSNT